MDIVTQIKKIAEVRIMAKDGQIDPKEVRKQKAKGGPTHAESALDGEGRNAKKQSNERDDV